MTHPVKACGQKQCLAFTKERRRCRLERNEGSKTCHIHRNYYYQWAEKELTKLKYCQWDTLTKRTQKEITFQLRFRHVVLNQEEVEKMFWNFTSVNGYERLILLSAVDPLWVKPLFKKILDNYMFYVIEYLIFHYKYKDFLESLPPFPDAVRFVYHYLHYRSILILSQSAGGIAAQQIAIDTILYLWQFSLTGTVFCQCLCYAFERKTYLADMEKTFITMFHSEELSDVNDVTFMNAIKTYERVLKKFVEPLWGTVKNRLFQKSEFSEELFSATIAAAGALKN
jgi:hypothetical protein